MITGFHWLFWLILACHLLERLDLRGKCKNLPKPVLLSMGSGFPFLFCPNPSINRPLSLFATNLWTQVGMCQNQYKPMDILDQLFLCLGKWTSIPSIKSKQLLPMKNMLDFCIVPTYIYIYIYMYIYIYTHTHCSMDSHPQQIWIILIEVKLTLLSRNFGQVYSQQSSSPSSNKMVAKNSRRGKHRQ